MSALLGDPLRGELRRLAVEIGAGDGRALLGETQRDGGADPSAGPGHQRDLPLEPPHAPSPRATTSHTSVPRWRTSPPWLTTSMLKCTTPVPGRDLDGRTW